MTKITSITPVEPNFKDVKRWFDDHLSLDKINLDDQRVYENVYHDARWAGVFQCTGKGSQNLFKRAKPKSILDIATLTSIFRPGPLAAKVDHLYLKAKNEGEQYDWGDSRINDLLAPTAGCLIFQEQVMFLAEKVAGFPKEKCDEVRRAIMKRSISGGEAAKKAAQETRDTFVQGAVKNGYSESVANNLYDKILYFAGYGFNAAHATAYAIDSYYCAFLLTHYEEQWIVAYLESMSSNDDNRAKAFGEVRSLGYQIVPLDVQHAGSQWRVLPGKKLMPSLLACKGIGASAVAELESMRPFETLEELLWEEDGSWRPSKFNRRALEALVHVGAFDSLGVVGEDKLFKNYHHMHRVLIEHNDEIKKNPKREPFAGKLRFYELVRELADTPPWTRQERANNIVAHFGTLDVNQLVDRTTVDKLTTKGVKSIDDYEDRDVYWGCVAKATPKKTKNGRKYVLLDLVGPASKPHRVFMWSWDGVTKFEDYCLVVASISANEFGFATSQKDVRVLDV